MKSQDYFSSTLFFPPVHVKKLTFSIKKTTTQDVQDNIAQHYILYIIASNFVVHL